MAWQTIAASETDANSPLNQTLMNKIRGNLDYLKQSSAQIKFIKAIGTPGGNSPTFILDDSIDWRDRHIRFEGMVMTSTSVIAASYQPGGSNDEYIHSQISSHGTKPGTPSDIKFIEGFFYSQDGSNAHNNEPYLSWLGENSVVTYFMFVDDGTGGDAGALKLRAFGANAPNNYGAWNLLVVYSEDQGEY